MKPSDKIYFQFVVNGIRQHDANQPFDADGIDIYNVFIAPVNSDTPIAIKETMPEKDQGDNVEDDGGTVRPPAENKAHCTELGDELHKSYSDPGPSASSEPSAPLDVYSPAFIPDSWKGTYFLEK